MKKMVKNKKPESISAKDVKKHLLSVASIQKAKDYARFFKTGKGEYGEGDVFMGVTVPRQRVVAKYQSGLFLKGYFGMQKHGQKSSEKNKHIDADEEKLSYLSKNIKQIQNLLKDKRHECRLTALHMMVYIFKGKKTDRLTKTALYELYINNFSNINNWDLVDTSARDIIGGYLYEFYTPAEISSTLSKWAHSKDLWIKRVSVISTFYFISNKSFNAKTNHTIDIARILLNDKHDLIHKAAGWMLREMGKRDIKPLLNFLDSYAKVMPRTMLRYAIEKLNNNQRKYYMNMKII